MTTRLSLPLALFLAGLACQPPLDINAAPKLAIVSPEHEAWFAETREATFQIDIVDEDGDPLSISVQDDLGGTLYEASDLASDSTVTFTATGLVPGAHTLTVTVDDGREGGQTVATRAYIINGAPTTPVITIEPEVPTTGNDMVAQLTTASVDSDFPGQVAYEWSWRRGDTTYDNGTTFPAVVPSSVTEDGETWYFEATVYEVQRAGGELVRLPEGNEVTVTRTILLDNAPPTEPTLVTVLPSTPHPAQPLRCVASGASDPDGTDVTYVYAWARGDNGSVTIDPAYTDAILPASATVPGETWVCDAAASDGAQAGPSLASSEVRVRGNLEPVSLASVVLTGETSTGFGSSGTGWDVTGEGYASGLLLGVPASTSGGADAGGLRLFTTPLFESVSAAAASDAKLVWGGSNLALGAWVQRVPDLTGDQLADLLTSAKAGSGEVWMIPSGTVDTNHVLAQDVRSDAARLIPSNGDGFGVMFAAGNLGGTSSRPELAIAQDLGSTATNHVWVLDGDVVTVGETVTVSLANAARIASGRLDDTFGHSMAMDGDFTGDGIADLVLGATRSFNLNERRGVYLFDGATLVAGQDLTEDDALITVGHNTGADAGAAVGFFPDLDGDGTEELWMSAPGFGAQRGRVGVFLGGITVPTDLDYNVFDQALTIEGLDEAGRFGEQVVLVGDLGNDGWPEIAVTAPGSASGQGKVFVFDGASVAEAFTTATSMPVQLDTEDAAWEIAGPAVGQHLTILGPVGDLDADGFDDLVLGSEAASTGDGQVYVWLSGR